MNVFNEFYKNMKIEYNFDMSGLLIERQFISREYNNNNNNGVVEFLIFKNKLFKN